ncbi:S41 family peptidase [Aquimarina macrocephali]|uniref:S41 family peptidase n=1 Tax=Aquimarina macrocephali TaxID=666563 RepID=UPI000A077E73|nr:S41 family peptidase [Aquimarina macrocephali]
MKYLKIKIYLLLFLAVFSSCEKALMEPNPKTDALAVFDEYTTLVQEKYAMLEFKNVNINTLRNNLRGKINNATTQKEFFEIIGEVTKSLRDGHSSLIEDQSNPNGMSVGFDLEEGYPAGIDAAILVNNYIGTTVNSEIKTLSGGQGFRAVWGTLPQDRKIGYLWIPSWNVEISDDEIERIFLDLKDTKGLIFDMRTNTGGDPALATKFASYFTDKPIYTGFERFKTGPGPKDFSDSHVTLQPSGSANKYLKPVMVLTDRNVYSASTTFLYSIDPVESIKTVGQRTGGGSGSVADGYLANGWYWSLSTSEFIDAQGKHLDDGVEPDIPVVLNLEDTAKDEVIERAILELK